MLKDADIQTQNRNRRFNRVNKFDMLFSVPLFKLMKRKAMLCTINSSASKSNKLKGSTAYIKLKRFELNDPKLPVK